MQRSHPRLAYSLPLRYSHLRLGDDPLVDLYTFEPTLGFQWLPDWDVLARVTVEYRDYDALDNRDGLYAAYEESLTWSPDAVPGSVSLLGRVFNEGADDKAYENLGWLAGLSGRCTLAPNVQAYASWTYGEARYDEREDLAPEKRQDDTSEGTVGISATFAEHWGIDLNVQYTDNESTFGIYSYERTRTTLSCYRFF